MEAEALYAEGKQALERGWPVEAERCFLEALDQHLPPDCLEDESAAAADAADAADAGV